MTTFPSLLPPAAAIVWHACQQLRAFERWPAARQDHLRKAQLGELLRHAASHSPFWCRRLAAAGIDPREVVGFECLSRLPVLTRADLQTHADDLRARTPVTNVDDIRINRTSGSTGEPVAVDVLSSVYGPLYHAITFIDHIWHGRSAHKMLASYLSKDVDVDVARWGDPIAWFEPPGPAYSRRAVERPVEDLFEALLRFSPSYVVAGSVVVRALADLAVASHGLQIEQFITSGDVISPELRAAAKRSFGASIADRYSCEELGWIALQCPEADHYHEMSAVTHVEIVDDAGRPCAGGEIGRVLLTGLHSYAMPLIRYEIGDLARRGEPCSCGIGLPVIAEIVGRTRDLITLPNGTRRIITFTDQGFRKNAPVLEYQVRLYTCGTVEALVRCSRPLVESERAALVAYLRARFDYPFRIAVSERAAIPSAGPAKRREFVRVDHTYAQERDAGSTGPPGG